jgi:hypothetical protein
MQARMVPETRKKEPSNNTPRAEAFKSEADKHISDAIFSPALNIRDFLFRIIKKTKWST